MRTMLWRTLCLRHARSVHSAVAASVPCPPWNQEHIAATLAALPRHRLRTSSGARTAAVLLPLCDDVDGKPAVLLCVRAAELRSHAGQICFPGGVAEADDADASATALREAEEEIGLEPANVRVLGQLRPVLSSGRMAVTPVVGFVKGCTQGDRLDCADLITDQAEIAAAFTLPLDYLLRPDVLTWHEIAVPRETMPRRVPAFRLLPTLTPTLPISSGRRPPGAPPEEVSVWGLTGFLLHTLLFEVLKLGTTAR